MRKLSSWGLTATPTAAQGCLGELPSMRIGGNGQTRAGTCEMWGVMGATQRKDGGAQLREGGHVRRNKPADVPMGAHRPFFRAALH